MLDSIVSVLWSMNAHPVITLLGSQAMVVPYSAYMPSFSAILIER